MRQPVAVRLDVGTRLNAARRRQGLSMARLAGLTELSISHVRELLNGKRSPTPAVARRLARVLKLDAEMADELQSAVSSRWISSFSGDEVRTHE